MHIDAINTLCKLVTLTFHLLITGSMHAEVVTRRICVPSLVLIAQVVFLLEHRQTHTHTNKQTQKVTDATDHFTHASATVNMDNYSSNGQTNVRDEKVDNVDGFSADFGVEVETSRLNASLLYDCLQQRKDTQHSNEFLRMSPCRISLPQQHADMQLSNDHPAQCLPAVQQHTQTYTHNIQMTSRLYASLSIRPRGHNYSFPVVIGKQHHKSFLPHCLFEYIQSYVISYAGYDLLA